MEAPELRELILEVYTARKDTKEYLEFYLNPDSEKLAEKYRTKIVREFVSRTGVLKRHPRRSVCKRAIADFKSFSPDPEVLAELMLTYISEADRWMRYNRRRVEQSFADSIVETVCSMIDVVACEGLMSKYADDILQIKEAAAKWNTDRQTDIADRWDEAQQRSMASLLSGGIEA